MKFCDKLIQLRKRNGFSQEELGEKLNVTRQTVSKWELGQSKPESDKLLEISKLFNVDFNLLMDDNIALEKYNGNKHFVDDDLKPRKWLLVVLIIIAIIIIVILGGKFVSDREDKKNNGLFDIIDNQINNDDFNSDFSDAKDKITKEFFNQSINMYIGTSYGSQVSSLLDVIITNNKTNSKLLITVKYEDAVTTNPTEIKNMKTNFSTSKKYEVSVEYNENGYINEILIEKYKDPADAEHFNWKYESSAGTKYGLQVNNLLDSIITNNKTNEDQVISVKYGSINTTDTNEIRNLKKSFSDWTEYEVILDYDKDGYVNLVTIES